MAKTATQAAPVKAEAETEQPKRKMLTPEQKVAKLEAELKAAREKAEARRNKGITEAKAKRAKLVGKRDQLNLEIATLTATIGDGQPDEDTES